MTWYCCTWWTRALSTERRSLKSSASRNYTDTPCCGTFFFITLFTHVPLSLYAPGETEPNPKMERQDTRKGDPGNQLQRRRPTPPERQREANLTRGLLPPQTTSCLRIVGVQPFHATQGRDTLLFQLSQVESQGITSLSLHQIKFARKSR